MPGLKWSDADEIGFQLSERFGDLNPLGVRFTDLRNWVTALEGFDDSVESGEKALEAIQMAWLEYYRQSHQEE